MHKKEQFAKKYGGETKLYLRMHDIEIEGALGGVSAWLGVVWLMMARLGLAQFALAQFSLARLS